MKRDVLSLWTPFQRHTFRSMRHLMCNLTKRKLLLDKEQQNVNRRTYKSAGLV